MAEELTAKQKQFIAEYLIDLNATQAAIRAGYSQKTAEVIGHENLSKPKIKVEIEKAMRQRQKRTEISVDRVLEELAAIGNDNKNYRAADRIKALELIGKHLGMFSGNRNNDDDGVQIIDDV